MNSFKPAQRLLLTLLAFALVAAILIISPRNNVKPIAPAPAPAAPESASNKPLAGRWFEAPSPDGLSDEAREQMQSIGYLQGYEKAGSTTGVLRHDRDKTCPGLNLVFSGHAPEVQLMDSDGKVLHTWSYRYSDIWKAPVIPTDRNLTFGETLAAQPDLDPKLIAQLPKPYLDSINLGQSYFRRAYLYPNGDLLTFFSFLGVVKLDKDSHLLWSNQMMAHHDVDVTTDGRIYIIGFVPRAVPGMGENGMLLDDYIAVLNPDGTLDHRISILDAFRNSPFADMVNAVPQELDLLHTNTVTILDGTLAARIPAFKAGNLLISCRNISTLAVLDPATGAIVWAKTGPWHRQHEPSVLPNGRLLLLDNQGNHGFSRVLEFDPVTLDIAWQYEGTPPESFSTLELGSAARLPNGNTLITESYKGHAFEITSDKQIVWDFLNPKRAGEKNELIAAVYEVVRLPDSVVANWLLPPSDTAAIPAK